MQEFKMIVVVLNFGAVGQLRPPVLHFGRAYALRAAAWAAGMPQVAPLAEAVAAAGSLDSRSLLLAGSLRQAALLAQRQGLFISVPYMVRATPEGTQRIVVRKCIDLCS